MKNYTRAELESMSKEELIEIILDLSEQPETDEDIAMVEEDNIAEAEEEV